METSLRQANSRIIAPEEEIHISIRNLVKIYGRPNEFQREWLSGQRTRERLGIKEEYHTLKDLQPLVWLLPLTAFMVYFTYSYQTLPFWAVVFAICTWLLVNQVISAGKSYFAWNNKRIAFQCMHAAAVMVYYVSPLLSLICIAVKFSDSKIATLLGLLWYISIAAHYLSKRIHKYNINIDQIEGRFRNIKKAVYQTTAKIPFLGYKKAPSKLLTQCLWIFTRVCSDY